jgi:hypothetical protein
MSDPDITDQLIKTGTHIAAGGGGAGLVGLWNKWRSEKQSERIERILNEQNIALALLKQQLETIAIELKRHEDFGERLALVEQKANAAHMRIDDLPGKRRR